QRRNFPRRYPVRSENNGAVRRHKQTFMKENKHSSSPGAATFWPSARRKKARRRQTPGSRDLWGKELSERLQVGGGGLAPFGHHLEADLLAFHERLHAGALDGADVHEHILAPVGRLDEAVALLHVEELHGTCRHSVLLFCTHRSTARARGARSATIRFFGRELIGAAQNTAGQRHFMPETGCSPSWHDFAPKVKIGSTRPRSADTRFLSKSNAFDRVLRPMYQTVTRRSVTACHCGCWIAESSQAPPRLRRNVHNSVASVGCCGSPSTTRPLARST